MIHRVSDEQSKVHRFSVDTKNPIEIFLASELRDEFIILENVSVSKLFKLES